jgi:flagellar motor switch protein FliM
VDLEPQFESVELNPMFTQIIPPSDMVVLLTLDVRIGEAFGLMNICLPFSVLEPIVDRLNAQFWFARTSKFSTAQSISAIQSRLAQAAVRVTAELGKSNITVGDLLGIGIGDVIQLEQPVKGLLPVRVGNNLKFMGSPGVSGTRMAVQISQFVQEEEGPDGPTDSFTRRD